MEQTIEKHSGTTERLAGVFVLLVSVVVAMVGGYPSCE